MIYLKNKLNKRIRNCASASVANFNFYKSIQNCGCRFCLNLRKLTDFLMFDKFISKRKFKKLNDFVLLKASKRLDVTTLHVSDYKRVVQ